MSAAIAAMGAVTGHGIGVEALFEALVSGRTAVRRSSRFVGRCLCSEFAAEAPPDEELRQAAQSLGSPVPPDRASRLLLAAAAEALRGRNLEPNPRRGVIVGTTKGALETTLEAWKGGHAAEVDPVAAPARVLAEASNALGPVRSVSAACASSSAALGEALSLIEDGTCDEVVVGGTEALHPFVYDGFHALKAMSPEPAAPFDAHRLGLSLGEGAGVVVLEAASPSNRGTLLAGFGSACDAHDLTAPEPGGFGLAAACRRSLRRAGIEPEHIDCYHAHGTATLQNDAMEAAVVRSVFPARRIPLTAIKGSIGHTLGAAGILDAIACATYLARRVLPPVANLIEVDRSMLIEPVKRHPVDSSAEWAIVATAGFGGINTAVVIRAPEDAP
jgi:3-oxoacyl-(acyl-carrier-protein) synthase